MLWIKIASYAIVLGVGFYGGYKVTANHYDAKASKILEAQIVQAGKQIKLDRELIQAHQLTIDHLESKYYKLRKQKNEIKIINNDCTLTNDAVRLWNESLAPEAVVPESTTGVTTGGGTSISHALDNKLINDNKCAINRQRLRDIKQWDLETFGK